MHKLFFSDIDPEQQGNAIASACRVGDFKPNPLNNGINDLLVEGPKMWTAVDSPEEADVAVYSERYRRDGRAEEFAEQADRAGLHCLMFDFSDDSRPAREGPGTVYRCSIDRSRRVERERALSPICPNIVPIQDNPPLRSKSPTPTISFCATVVPTWRRLVKRYLQKDRNLYGAVVRSQAIRHAKRCRQVKTDFIVGNKYMGGAGYFRHDTDRVNNIRERYRNNLLSGDYVLCIRGTGNYSFRFYETLSAGRIPLLVDTVGLLPLDDKIDWKQHALIVDVKDLENIGERVAEHYDSLTEDSFVDLQRSNRELYFRSLSPSQFLKAAVERAAALKAQPSAAPSAF
ncbi:MAG: hypothetical protein AAF589_02500 [Planctomycetota bacterium]